MAWFKKTRKPIESSGEKPSRVPEGLWVKCPGCSQIIYNKDLDKNLQVCPKCAHHFRINAAERLQALFDAGEWTEYFPNLTSNDPLKFTDTKPYRTRLKDTISKTGMRDAIVIATGKLDGLDVVVAAMEYSFIGGSMGVVVGEKITRAIEIAIDRSQPVIIVSCSGGARMMEGALSQGPCDSCARSRHPWKRRRSPSPARWTRSGRTDGSRAAVRARDVRHQARAHQHHPSLHGARKP